jgi:hypothetical protein
MHMLAKSTISLHPVAASRTMWQVVIPCCANLWSKPGQCIAAHILIKCVTVLREE